MPYQFMFLLRREIVVHGGRKSNDVPASSIPSSWKGAP
jgi:hypothetical protein